MSNVDKNAEILLVNPTATGGTINLPLTSTLPYRTLTIKHIGSTSLNGITIATQGPDTFEDGTTSYVFSRITTFVTFYANASANKWVLVGGTNSFTQTISSLTVNTINGQTYVPISPIDLVSTSLLTSSLVSTMNGLNNLVVTQILAGTNVTISPPGGRGIVTINASGGGGGSGEVTSTNLTSTTLGLGTLGYISSLPRFLSTNALFTSSFVASTISTTNTLFTNVLVARNTNLSSAYVSDLTVIKSYISSLQVDELILGPGDGWIDTGPLRATYISSLQENTGSLYATNIFVGNTSTLNTIRYWGLKGNYNNTILAEMSTGTAFGAQEFLVFKGSSANDRIRFQTTGDIRFEPQVAAREFSTATALATPTLILQSNLVGINTVIPIATLDVRGTAFATTISSQQLFTNALVARSTNLSSVYISSLTAVVGYVSSLTTDSLTIGDGNGWVDFGAARAVVFSSVQENTGSLYATTAYIGNTSTLNQIRYWGLFGNYNNTILAEVSTGSVVGAQEFLVFKGSSTSDRIRFQTTGDIRFEPQVAAREFSTATALAIPTMILQSNLVGINNAAPTTTLDVTGTIRGQIVSTLALNISSINGLVYSSASFSNLVSTAFLDTTLQSTVANLGQIYLSTATGGGGITTGNLVSTVEGLGTLNYISGPTIITSNIIALDTLAGVNTSASTLKLLGLTDTYDDFPPWINSNQIAGSDPDPAPLRLDVFGSARILKNLYVGSTTTILTTAGVQAAQISSLNTTASTVTLSDKGPLFASTNTVTSITDVFLNDSYVAQRIPIKPVVISTILDTMFLQPEFLGMHFVLINDDSNYSQFNVRMDSGVAASVPDGWYCYLKQMMNSNFYYNNGVAALTDVGTVVLPLLEDTHGQSNYQGPLKFIVSGGLTIPY